MLLIKCAMIEKTCEKCHELKKKSRKIRTQNANIIKIKTQIKLHLQSVNVISLITDKHAINFIILIVFQKIDYFTFLAKKFVEALI